MNQFIFYLVLAIAVIIWGLSYRRRERMHDDLKRTLYDYKMRIDFMQAIILHNTGLGRLSDISQDTVRKMKLTPAHFEYFKYDEYTIKKIFPDYNTHKISFIDKRLEKENTKLKNANEKLIQERRKTQQAYDIAFIKTILPDHYELKDTGDKSEIMDIKESIEFVSEIGIEQKDEWQDVCEKLYDKFSIRFDRAGQLTGDNYTHIFITLIY